MSASAPQQTTTQKGRHVFISASYLVHFYKQVPADVMSQAIFFFGSDRRWVFPKTLTEEKMSKAQPTDYLSMPSDFKDLILEKEKQGLVYWLKPAKDYQLVSQFFENIDDPVTKEKYKRLILDPKWWNGRTNAQSKFGISGKAVLMNFVEGEHDYSSVMELLYQSNNTLIPQLMHN